MAVCKKQFNYKPVTSNNDQRLLLFCCYADELEIYELQLKDVNLLLRCCYINQGLAHLTNHLHNERESRDIDPTYLRSITDPDYVLQLQ
jgi:hypothetical protein